jgi:hypothetical protein
VARDLVEDVDAESLAQCPDRKGMDTLLGPAAGTEDLGVALGAVPQERFGDRRSRAVAGTREQHPRPPRSSAGDRRRWPLPQGERRMQRRPGGDQRVRTAVEVQVVVGVTAIEAAAPGRDQPTTAQLPQVVGHQVLRPADQRGQLTHPKVAGGQLRQQVPSHRMAGQPHE